MDAEWRYGGVAAFYDARPPYAAAALDASLAAMRLPPAARICDVGAGTGRLTHPLVARGFATTAVEPDPAMRARGAAHAGAAWVAGVAEALPLAANVVECVSFGSSFNVVATATALRESARVLVPGGWIFCVWNHRVLDDPLQARIEAAIRRRVPGYAYGTRRTDQGPVIAASGLFHPAARVAITCVREVETARWLAAWRSHLTLRRQAGEGFDGVLAAIDDLAWAAGPLLAVPYATVAWIARRR